MINLDQAKKAVIELVMSEEIDSDHALEIYDKLLDLEVSKEGEEIKTH